MTTQAESQRLFTRDDERLLLGEPLELRRALLSRLHAVTFGFDRPAVQDAAESVDSAVARVETVDI